MPLACQNKRLHGPQFCIDDCPANAPCGVFRYVRVEDPAAVPPPGPHAIDIAILDMNHGWPNLGHDSLVQAVLDVGCDLMPVLEGTGLYLRALSFDVRRRHVVPEPPGGRFAVYLGTGGPGHLDPHRNRDAAEGSQGLEEDPAWERPLFELFDRVLASETAALLAVCHTFGVMCRWAGVAEPELRGPEKGGKSTGVLENLLSPEARRHPWFGQLCAESQGGRLRVVDNRLFDLVPKGALPAGMTPVGYETLGVGGPRGDALTMLEFARDGAGVMPRVFGVNHHPEIVDRRRQLMILDRKQRDEGERIPARWYAERREILTRSYESEDSEARLRLTSSYTLVRPLRFHLHRQVRLRAAALGLSVDLHEDRVHGGAEALVAGALGCG